MESESGPLIFSTFYAEVCCVRTARPILDHHRRVIAVLVGRPKDITDDEWEKMHQSAVETWQAEHSKFQFNCHQLNHRRAECPAVDGGPSFGGGQRVSVCSDFLMYPIDIFIQLQLPGNLRLSKVNLAVLTAIFSHFFIQRLVGIASGMLHNPICRAMLIAIAGAFCAWAPKLHQYYIERMRILFQHHPDLIPNLWPPGFPNEPPLWAGATLNDGPQTVCYRHHDYSNLTWGWCCILCFGKFDFKRGGHFIFWDMKVAIEFPPGSIILMPSAILEHSNATLYPEPGCFHYSLTLYTAGGLFRWVENGCRTAAAFEKADPVAKAKVDDAGKHRFATGLGMFSTLEELTGQVYGP